MTAKTHDAKRHERVLEEHREATETASRRQSMAKGVLGGDPAAYLEAIREADPFTDIMALGEQIALKSEASWYVEATLSAHAEEVIPSESKALLKNGKLSVKTTPIGQFHELYQDHICSCALRIGRELLTLLPPLQFVFVHVETPLLNTATGHLEATTVLSVALSRKTMSGLNFEMVDPSDSMRNFVHRMEFKKTRGFCPCERLRPSEFGISATEG